MRGRAEGGGLEGEGTAETDTRLAKLAVPARPAVPATRGSHAGGRNRGKGWHRRALRAGEARAAATKGRCGAAWAGPWYPGDRSLAPDE